MVNHVPRDATPAFAVLRTASRRQTDSQIAALRGTPIAQAQRGRRLPGSHRLHGRPITFSIRRWYVFQRPLLEAALDLRAHYDACAGTPWWHFEYETLLSGSVSHFLKGNRRHDASAGSWSSAFQSVHVPVVLVRPNSSYLLRMAACAQRSRSPMNSS